MTGKSSRFLHFGDIPNLHVPVVSSKRKMWSLKRPSHCSRGIGYSQVAKLIDFRISSVPQVNAGGKTNCEEVLRGPVNEIEVVVILEGGRVQYFDGDLVDPSFLRGGL